MAFIQLDLPNEIDLFVDIYRAKNRLSNKREAIISIIEKFKGDCENE